MEEARFAVESFMEAWRYMVAVCCNKQWCQSLTQRPVIEIFQYTDHRAFDQAAHDAYFFIQDVFRFSKS